MLKLGRIKTPQHESLYPRCFAKACCTTPIRFFNPRIDIWDDHFDIEATGLISEKTLIGAATIKILDINQPESIIERCEMIRFNLF